MQSTPVCKLQGRVGAAEGGGGGGGGGLLVDDEDTDEEEGSDDATDKDKGVRPQPAEEEGQGGGLLGLGTSFKGGGLAVIFSADP